MLWKSCDMFDYYFLTNYVPISNQKMHSNIQTLLLDLICVKLTV